jgi:adenosine deaminase
MGDHAIEEVIKQLPKVELHIHGEAVIGFDSYHLLNQKYKIEPALKHPEDFKRLFAMSSLRDMIKNFLFLQSMFREPADFKYLISDIEKYCKSNNIGYMEMHIAPSTVLRQGFLGFDDMFNPIVEGFDALEASGGPIVKVIVDLSRTFGHENAEKNYNGLTAFLAKRKTGRIIGVGLGGQEQGNSCLVYKDLFEKAKAAGLHVVAHAGEEVGPESIWDAVREAGADRIGHGTSAIQDEDLMAYLKDRAIPVEVCPTSNIITGKYVKNLADHPVREFIKRGLLVTIATDDPVLFNITLNREYANLAKAIGLGIADIGLLLSNGIDASFMTEAEKEARHETLAAALGKAIGKKK